MWLAASCALLMSAHSCGRHGRYTRLRAGKETRVKRALNAQDVSPLTIGEGGEGCRDGATCVSALLISKR